MQVHEVRGEPRRHEAAGQADHLLRVLREDRRLACDFRDTINRPFVVYMSYVCIIFTSAVLFTSANDSQTTRKKKKPEKKLHLVR